MVVTFRSRLSALLAAALCALAASAPVRAADSQAPRGAPKTWLPATEWVLEHWLPYDQNQLFAALHLNIDQVRIYLASDPNAPRVPPLAARVRAAGLTIDRLATRLVSAGDRHLSRALRATLISRAVSTLTQGHLLQHLFFHPFHDKAITWASQQIFGVSPVGLGEGLYAGLSRRQIGREHGRTSTQMISTTLAVLRHEQALGIASHQTTSSEAVSELSLQMAALPAWLDERRAAAVSPQSPLFGAGQTAAGAAGQAGRAQRARAILLLCRL